MSQITDYQSLIKEFTNICKIYFTKLDLSGFSSSEPYVSAEVKTILKDLSSNVKIIEIKKIEDLFELWNDFSIEQNNIAKIVKIIEEYRLDFGKQGSQSSSGSTITANYISELYDLAETIILQSEKLRTEQPKPEIFDDKIVSFVKKMDIVKLDELNKLYLSYLERKQGQCVIQMFMYILKVLMHELPALVKQVNKILERLKSQILETPEIKLIGQQNKLSNAIQNLIQMHNLVPNAMSVELPELLEKLGYSGEAKAIDKVLPKVAKTLSTTNKFGFIVISKATKKPLEYNFWTLFDKDYIQKNNLEQAATFGLNLKTIERYRTIAPLELESKDVLKDSVQVFNDEFIPDSDQNFYYVIETLNGTLFRFLIRYDIVPGRDTTLYVPASWLENILNKDLSPSKRLENYNIILNNQIQKYLKKPYTTLSQIDRDEIQREEGYWRVIKQKVQESMMLDFTNLFTEMFIYKDEINIKKMNTGSITELFLNDQLYKRALIHITENIETDSFKGSLRKLDKREYQQVIVELILAYYYDFNNIQKNIKRDVENLYKKDYIQRISELLRSSNESRILFVKNKILEIYRLITTEVLDKYINKKSSIYLNIQKKIDILKSTLFLEYSN
jgi:hypothetical protein